MRGQQKTHRVPAALQQAVASTALGGPWVRFLQPETCDDPPLDTLLHHVPPAGLSPLPLRPCDH